MEQAAKIPAAVTAPEVYRSAQSSHISVPSATSTLASGIEAKRPNYPFLSWAKFQDWKIGQPRKSRCLGAPALNAEHKDCVGFQHCYIHKNRPFLQHIHMKFCVKQQIMEIILIPIILVAACLEYRIQFWAISLPGEKQTNWRQLKDQLKWFGGWKERFMRNDDELNTYSFTEMTRVMVTRFKQTERNYFVCTKTWC